MQLVLPHLRLDLFCLSVYTILQFLLTFPESISHAFYCVITHCRSLLTSAVQSLVVSIAYVSWVCCCRLVLLSVGPCCAVGTSFTLFNRHRRQPRDHEQTISHHILRHSCIDHICVIYIYIYICMPIYVYIYMYICICM